MPHRPPVPETPAAGPRSSADGGEAALAQDAPTLTLGAATPHTVVDAVGERVLQAFSLHRAVGADAPGPFHADAVGREELARRSSAAQGLLHPRRGVVVGEGGVIIHSY